MVSSEAAVEGWSLTLCHTAEAAELLEVRASPELDRLVDGEPPEFLVVDVGTVDPFVSVRQTVILGTALEPRALGPFPDGVSLLDLRYEVFSDSHLKFCDHVGSVSFDNFVTIEGIDYIPRDRTGTILVAGDLGESFIRGDADLSGATALTDAVFILQALFLGGPQLPCLDAADANDVGRVDIADPIYLLRYLFLGGMAPPAPFPDPGSDISPATSHGCERGL